MDSSFPVESHMHRLLLVVVEGSWLHCSVQCEAMLETPMTYSLFEFARESADDIVTLPDPAETERVSSTVQTATTTQSPPPKRKEALSKQAKRRLAGRTSESRPLLTHLFPPCIAPLLCLQTHRVSFHVAGTGWMSLNM